jgi:hypothetical protein
MPLEMIRMRVADHRQIALTGGVDREKIAETYAVFKLQIYLFSLQFFANCLRQKETLWKCVF